MLQLWTSRLIGESETHPQRLGKIGKSAHDAVGDAQIAARRIVEITRDLRRYARRGTIEQQCQTSLRAIVESAVRLLQPRIRSVLNVEIDIDVNLCVLGDPRRLEQVFINLLGNSADAVQDTPGTARVSARYCNDRIVVTCSDDGPGLAPEIASRIFEPFFSTKEHEDGTGLGLMIAEEIVRSHQGTIRLCQERLPRVVFEIQFLAIRSPDRDRAAPSSERPQR